MIQGLSNVYGRYDSAQLIIDSSKAKKQDD